MRRPGWKICRGTALMALCVPAVQAAPACDDPVAVARRFQQASVDDLLDGQDGEIDAPFAFARMAPSAAAACAIS